MPSSSCCFLTCMQVSQEAGQVVWYSHLFQNFPQCVVIHTVKAFGIVNKAEIYVFWNSIVFSMIQGMLAIWSLVLLPFLKPQLEHLELHGSCTAEAWLGEFWALLYSVFSSVAQSCLTLCYPMNRNTAGLPVHHQLLEFTQTHVHQVSYAIQPSHPLLSPSPPAPNPSHHQGLFQWVNSSHEVAKVLEFQL